jgi:DNA-binding winged helix-turn-helix (wHTH) protein/tetratricopeptide (TPR) repeat protein
LIARQGNSDIFLMSSGSEDGRLGSKGTVFRFAGFELDQARAELRGADGKNIKLRPKAFEMLELFAVNTGRVIGKHELLATIWPNVQVGDDSLFQCIRELRTALGDHRRQMIRLVSRRGYLFAVEVLRDPAPLAVGSDAALSVRSRSVEAPGQIAGQVGAAEPVKSRGWRPAIVVMPIAAAGSEVRGVALATQATDRLIDGLVGIAGIRVVEQRSSPADSAEPASEPRLDFVLKGELHQDRESWVLRARMMTTATRELQPIATVTIDIDEDDTQLQQSRLAAGIGHPLARRLNALQESGGDAAPTHETSIVIEQALASINQTARDRFAVAQAILENAIAAEPDNLDLQITLAALQLRGIQMVWYDATERASAEKNVRSLLEHALKVKPNYLPVLDAYCRFLTSTNQFVESLVACANALSFDPWNGLVRYHLGLTQLQLGRFEEAFANFELAYRFNTPEVSQWTWTLGAGWAQMLIGGFEDALPWLHRSLAITPASGRTHMLLAAAHQQLGQISQARAALTKGLALRPGSTASNVPLPKENASPVFLQASNRLIRLMIAAGLPDA